MHTSPKQGFQPPAAVGARVTFAPPAMDPELELDLLAPTRTPAALLRAAWLQLQQQRPQRALDATSEVLYGARKPSTHEESFARYLRAEAYEQLGQAERGAWDRARAAELAIDTDLRALLAQDRRPTGDEPPRAGDIELVVQPRNAWQAKAPDRSNVEPMGRIHRLTIHHSAMYFRNSTPATCAAQIQRIQREHMGNRGYGDIGYHYVIDPAGRIWQGRELKFQGAHASGSHNVGNVGICVLGNFVRGRTGQGPTSAQVRALRQLTAAVMQRHDIPAERIYSHSDFKATDCPGPLLQPVVDQLVRDMHRSGPAAIAAAAAGP